MKVYKIRSGIEKKTADARRQQFKLLKGKTFFYKAYC